MKRLYYKVVGPNGFQRYTVSRSRAHMVLRDAVDLRTKHGIGGPVKLMECRTDPDLTPSRALLMILNGDANRVFLREHLIKEL